MIPAMSEPPNVNESPSLPAPKTPDLVKPKLSIDVGGFKSPNPIVSPSKQKAKKATLSPTMLSPSTRRRKRRVKFNKVVHNRRIPHLNDLSEAEVCATWIQPEDYLNIRNRCIGTVKKMMKGDLTREDLDSETHCPRGLEGKTREGSTMRREHKIESIAAVLEEQTMQWNEDTIDEEAIMEVYSYFSIPCAESAQEAALKDAAAAHAYLHEDNPSPSTKTSLGPEHATSTPLSPVGAVASGMVDRLRDILFLRSSNAALLQEIENIVYNEAAMERRRTVYEKPDGNALASQLRQYFSAQGASNTNSEGFGEHDVPSLASSQYSDSTEEDSSSGSCHVEDDGITSGDNFTTQLQNHFYSRKRRQALLESIERGFFDSNEAAIVTVSSHTSSVTSSATTNVTAISNSLGSMLDGVFNARSKRKAVCDELRASTHLR